MSKKPTVVGASESPNPFHQRTQATWEAPDGHVYQRGDQVRIKGTGVKYTFYEYAQNDVADWVTVFRQGFRSFQPEDVRPA